MPQNDLMDGDLNPIIRAELESKRALFRASVTSSVGINPDEQAKYNKIATFLDQPKGVVTAMPAEAERSAAIKRIADDSAPHPVLQQKYTDADFAKLANDDSGALATIAAAAKYMVSAPDASSTLTGDIAGAYYGGSSGVAAAFGAVSRTAGAPLDWLDNTSMPGGNPLRRLSEGFMQISDRGAALKKAAEGKSETWLGGAISSGVQSLGQNLMVLPMAFLPGGQAATLTSMAAMSGGQSYQKDMADGQTHWKSLIHGTSDAVIEAGTEMMPLGGLVHEMKAGTPLMTAILKNAWQENKGEQIATVLQDFNDWAINDVNKGKTFGAYLADRPAAAAQTLIATLVGAGGNVTLMHGLQGALDQAAGFDRQAQVAEQHAQVLQELQTTMQASKLLERSPEHLQSYAQDLLNENVPNVYVDPAKLVEAGVKLQELAAAVPSVAAQLEQAGNGVDLVIPTGELLATTIGATFAQPLIDNARTDVNGMSRIEAKDYMATKGDAINAEIERVMTEKQNDTEFKAGRDEVQGQILQQLNTIQRFTPKVNEHYATLAANFYSVMAARTGMTVQNFAKTYQLGFDANTAQGSQVMDQKVLNDLSETVFKPQSAADVQAGYSNRFKNPITLKDGTRLSGFTDPAQQTTFHGYDKNGEQITLRREYVKPEDIVSSRDSNRTADKVREALAQTTLNQDARGQIAFGNDITQQASIISLLKNADLSTYIHESGHFFLEVQADLAKRIAARIAQSDQVSDGEKSILNDFTTALKWMGITGDENLTPLDQWSLMSAEDKRPHHEQFARGFEAYAFEGKAPSLDLQSTFQTFRAWLVNVYRTIKDKLIGDTLNVQLNPEVRAVMDRMLATSDAIEEAEAARAMGPLFKSAEEGGMDLEAYKAYHDMGTQATQDAIQELQGKGLRDMQWLQNARSRKLKELQKQHDALRAQIEREVRAEVMSQQIYQVWQFLTAKAEGKALPGVTDLANADLTQASGKLRTQVLRDMYGIEDDAIWRKLSALHMTSDETGLHPDLVAESFGYSSGDELVQKLTQAEPPKSVIEGLTDKRMLEEHGDLATPAGLERAADAAIHNDARVKFVATELRAIEHAMNVREKVPGQKNTVDVLARMAREHATRLIAGLKVRDVRPAQYAAAEARAAKAAEKARGDLEKQAAAKRNQLINLWAAKAAYAAQDEVQAAIEYFKKFDTVSKSLDPEYQSQIHALLERFDLRKSVSLKEIEKRKSLVEWVADQVDQGLEPSIPPGMLQEANRKHFKDMTVEEIRGLRDTIKQIEHLGRLKNKLLTAQEQRDFAQAVAEITGSIAANANGRTAADTRTPNTLPALAMQSLKNFWASHIKAATWARVMDGGKDGGKVWEYLIRTANDAGNNEVVMREKATKELAKLVAPVLKQGQMGGKGVFFESINRTLNREAILAIALNTGNMSNLQRLLGGESWNIQQLQPVLDTLSLEDWTFVQAVWDHFESYRPMIAAKETRVYGKEPDWVEPTPVVTKHGTFRGGYYPVKFDPRASGKAEMHADAEAAQQQLKGAYTSATTRRTFTKTRVEEVKGRPLLYSMDGIYNGVQEVIHDLTWHEWLIDANKLLRNKAVDATIRNTYGPDVVRQFKDWVADNAEGGRGAQGAGEMAAAWVRQGVSVSGLGLNVMSALMQPMGLTQSIVRIGPKWVGRGLSKAIGAPVETNDQINEKSEFMRTRSLTRLREIAEIRSQVKGRSQVREAVDASAYFLMMRCQQLVDVPTWWGAYEKAISEGNNEDRAVALSDQAVIDAQGSGGTKDQAAIERGGPALKLFTVFYSFFNTALNLGVGQTMTHENKAKLAADYLLLFTIPALLTAALKDALTPGDSGDWDDPEKMLKRLIGEQISFLMGLMVGVREMSGAVQAVTGTNQFGTDYSGPAGTRFLADLVRLAKQVHQGEIDTGLRKAIVNTAGELLRLPSAQINRTITGIEALADGKTSNPGVLLTGYQEPH